MTVKLLDAAFETTTTTGTGAYTLQGAQAGHQSFAAAGSGSKVFYQVNDGTSTGVVTQREIGIGTVTITGGVTTISRDNILYSTNSNSAVSWGSNTKNVIGSIPALGLLTRDEKLNFVEGFGPVAGSANTLTITLPVDPLGYSDGMQIAGFIANTNTTASPTINVNGLGAKALKLRGVNPGIGVLVAGQLLVARYSASLGWFELIAPIPAPVIPVIIQPTRQYLLASGTYNTPANCKSIIVKMVGGGGGGAGIGSGTAGQPGGATSFNSINANGGGGGQIGGPGTPGIGGTNGTGTALFRQAGGTAPNQTVTATRGGDSRLGFGAYSPGGQAGQNAAANSGGGGGAGGSGTTSQLSNGPGGGGEYVEFIINNPAATYAYTIGAGGAKGTGTNSGGDGGTGLIIVEEYYG